MTIEWKMTVTNIRRFDPYYILAFPGFLGRDAPRYARHAATHTFGAERRFVAGGGCGDLHSSKLA